MTARLDNIGQFLLGYDRTDVLPEIVVGGARLYSGTVYGDSEKDTIDLTNYKIQVQRWTGTAMINDTSMTVENIVAATDPVDDSDMFRITDIANGRVEFYVDTDRDVPTTVDVPIASPNPTIIVYDIRVIPDTTVTHPRRKMFALIQPVRYASRFSK